MTSFEATEIYESGFRPTFRIQGQVYHRIGCILPFPNQQPAYLQIYLMSEAAEQVRRRVSILPSESIDHRIIIKADRRPQGDHPRRYNAPSASEVAVIMVGESSDRRDVVLQQRTGDLVRICKTHRSYDPLQYHLMFCRGEDGYHFLYRHKYPISIGRVYTIHPQNQECFYLRLLLHHFRGSTSFESLRTVDGHLCPTYMDACRVLGLLDDDVHWEEALRQAFVFDCPYIFRELFAILILFCDPANSIDLWIKFRDSLSEDYLRQAQRINPNASFENSNHLYDLCLQAIQEITMCIGNKTLGECHLPTPRISIKEINSSQITVGKQVRM